MGTSTSLRRYVLLDASPQSTPTLLYGGDVVVIVLPMSGEKYLATTMQRYRKTHTTLLFPTWRLAVSTQTYILGHEVVFKDTPHIVVRQDKCIALFENPDGTVTKIEEEFVQLRSELGEFEFVQLYEKIEPFIRASNLKTLPTIPWRIK